MLSARTVITHIWPVHPQPAGRPPRYSIQFLDAETGEELRHDFTLMGVPIEQTNTHIGDVCEAMNWNHTTQQEAPTPPTPAEDAHLVE